MCKLQRYQTKPEDAELVTSNVEQERYRFPSYGGGVTGTGVSIMGDPFPLDFMTEEQQCKCLATFCKSSKYPIGLSVIL